MRVPGGTVIPRVPGHVLRPSGPSAAPRTALGSVRAACAGIIARAAVSAFGPTHSRVTALRAGAASAAR